jgi:hypothetical protein
MFIIRNKQIQQLDRIRQADFMARLRAALSADFPAFAAGDAKETDRRLTALVQKANAYGFRSEFDVASYIYTAVHLGADFDTVFPAMQELLSHRELALHEKLEEMEELKDAIFDLLETQP